MTTGLSHRAVCLDDGYAGPKRKNINAARADAAKHQAANPDHDVEVITEQPGAMLAPRATAAEAVFALSNPDPFAKRVNDVPTPILDERVHVLKPGTICDTEARGHRTPGNRRRTEIVVDAPGGIIPLWAPKTTLRWRFQERSLQQFANPMAAKAAIRSLFASALLAWGSAAPVKFAEDDDVWDFEFVIRPSTNCNATGCVLASAFFPDTGRHRLNLYPTLFEQPEQEQVDTMVHEIGHVFGLRHFFAQVSETEFPSQIFGKHAKFSIMNYGSLSTLTNDDRLDLRRLYSRVWRGKLKEINGTPIRLVMPFSKGTSDA